MTKVQILRNCHFYSFHQITNNDDILHETFKEEITQINYGVRGLHVKINEDEIKQWTESKRI